MVVVEPKQLILITDVNFLGNSMNDENKTKTQLIAELKRIRQRVSVFTESGNEPGATIETLQENGVTHSESNHVLKNVLDHTNILAAYLDPQFNFIWVNRAYAVANKHEPSFFPRKNHFDLYPDEENKAIFQRAVDTGEPLKVTAKPFEHPERGETYRDWSLVPEKEATGKVTGLVFTLAEVTERKQTEEALQEKENKYRVLFEQSTDASLIIKGDKFVDCNQATVKMLGCVNRNEVLETHPSQLSPEKQPDGRSSLEKANEMMSIAFENGSHRFEWDHKRRNGEVFPVEVLLTAIPYREGNFLHVVWRDITERKRAEETLQKNESLLADTGRMAKVGGWELDTETFEFVWTEEVYRIHEIPLGQIPSLEDATNFYHPEDRPKMAAVVQRALKHGEPWEGEFRFITAKGKNLWTRSIGKPIIVDGKTVKLTGAFQDITERKRTEEALRESEAKYRKLVERAQEGIWVIDQDSNTTFVNPSMAAMLGYTPVEMLGKHLFSFMDQQSVEIAKATMKRRRQGVKEQHDFEFIRKDGSCLIATMAAAPILDKYGEYSGAIAGVLDITERKLAENALGESERNLKTLVESTSVIPWRFDLKKNQFTYIGKQVESILGCSVESWTDLDSWSDRIHADERQQALDFCMCSTKKGEDHEFEYRFIGTNGKILWVRDIVTVKKDEKGVPCELIGFMVDITAQKQVEEALLESEVRFRSLFENSPIAIWEEDFSEVKEFLESLNGARDGDFEAYLIEHPDIVKVCASRVKIVDVNQAALRLHNAKDKNELFIGLEKTFTDASFTTFRKELVALRKGETTVHSEGRVKTLDGHERDIELHWSVAPGYEQSLARVLVTTEDITDRKQAEIDLKKLSTAIEQSPTIVMITNPKGDIEYVNPKFTHVTGYSVEEVLGRNPRILQGREVPKQDYKELWQTILAGKEWRGQFHNKKKNGELYWEEASISAIYDNTGKISSFLALKEDITKHKKADEDLRESEKHFRDLVEQSNDAIYVMQDGKHILVNKAFENMFGYSVKEILHKDFDSSNIVAPNSRKFIEKRKALRASGGTLNKTFEFQGLTRSGSIIHLDVKLTNILWEGKPALQGIYRDFTERKLAEVSLRQYEHIVSSSTDMMALLNKEYIYTAANTAYLKAFGLTSDQIIGQPIYEVFGEEFFKTVIKPKADRCLAGEEISYQAWFNFPISGSRFMDITYYPYTDAENKIQGFVVNGRDITMRKRAEMGKAKLEEQLHRAQKLETIGTLAGGIAHDFNNILTPIMGYADMALADLESNDPLRDDLLHVLKGANRAKDLVEQILMFSKQVEKEREPLFLHVIVKEALKLLRPSIPATIEIRQRIDNSCNKIFADATQMHEVVVNLCTNASQAMEVNGGILTIGLDQVELDSAQAKLYPNLDEQEYVRLIVSDTGSGMDDKTLDRIFEPFFTTKAVNKGTGMGLSVVHGIVRSHQGDILVTSESGKGSTFHVYLPTTQLEQGIADKEPEAIVGGQESILVVDDESVVGNVVQRMLERLGYKIFLYDNSLEALKAFRDQPDKYDLMISDLTMPNITGLDLSEQLKRIRPKFSTIIMTGYGENLPEDILKHYGIQDVIGKPIRIRELSGCIRKIFDK